MMQRSESPSELNAPLGCSARRRAAASSGRFSVLGSRWVFASSFLLVFNHHSTVRKTRTSFAYAMLRAFLIVGFMAEDRTHAMHVGVAQLKAAAQDCPLHDYVFFESTCVSA